MEWWNIFEDGGIVELWLSEEEADG